MKSTLAPNADATEIGRLDIALVKNLYKEVDTERFFQGLSHISKMKCSATGYAWYAPAQICGDGKFYNDLYGKAAEEYYPTWRWAWGAAMEHIRQGDTVLEVGSGGLQFLHHLKEKNIAACGLEINPMSMQKAKHIGLEVHAQTIQAFSPEHVGKYDVVCFFEVLEHVYDVHAFLSAASEALRPGGKMIFSVPNNASFIKDQVLKLNLPPHHVGLWTPESIAMIGSVLPLRFEQHQYEPLPEGHLNWFLSTKEKNDIDKYPRAIRTLYYRLGWRKWRLAKLRSALQTLQGQTILSVFTKAE